MKELRDVIQFDGQYTDDFQESSEFMPRDVKLIENKESGSLLVRLSLFRSNSPVFLQILVDLKNGKYRISIDKFDHQNFVWRDELIQVEKTVNEDRSLAKKCFLRLRRLVSYRLFIVVLSTSTR